MRVRAGAGDGEGRRRNSDRISLGVRPFADDERTLVCSRFVEWEPSESALAGNVR